MRFAIEIYSRRTILGKKRHYFRVRAKGNGEIVAQGEGYINQGDCIQTAMDLRAHMFNAEIRNLA